MDEIEKKEIYECLIDMCVQYLGDMDGIWLDHECMSAGENALDLLKRAGLAESEDNYSYKIIKSKHMGKTELKPCPFCGDAVDTEEPVRQVVGSDWYMILCCNCGLSMIRSCREDLRKTWNMRLNNI